MRYNVFWQNVAALIWSIAWKLTQSLVGRGSLSTFGFAHLSLLVGGEDGRWLWQFNSEEKTLVARNLVSSQSCGISLSEHGTSPFYLKFLCSLFTVLSETHESYISMIYRPYNEDAQSWVNTFRSPQFDSSSRGVVSSSCSRGCLDNCLSLLHLTWKEQK